MRFLADSTIIVGTIVCAFAALAWLDRSRASRGLRDHGPDVPSQPLGPSRVRPVAPSFREHATAFELIAEGFAHGGSRKWK